MKLSTILGLLAGLTMIGSGCAAGRTSDSGANAVASVRVVLEEPTLVCLGVRWYVRGDQNGNASVRVLYRRAGERAWRKALPLFRVGNSDAPDAEKPYLSPEINGRWPIPRPNLFAGSIFDLRPDTAYEIKLELSDPDGGAASKILQARTRAEPIAPAPKRVLHVVPGDGGGAGSPADPIRGLAAANEVARPGDLFLIHAGVYEGTFETDKSGTPEAPIVWRGAGDGEAVIDAKGAPRGVSANLVHDVFFEGLSVRNAQFGMVPHGASNVVVRRCHFYDNEYGFAGYRQDRPMKGFYIADNLFEGPSTWPRTKGIEDARAIQVSGEGHVVCYNRIRGFGDGIDIMSHPPNRAIDFYGNEISECTDDAIELDYGETNVRAFRNRITNCFEGISTQPLYGGPAYIFRNAMYNLEYTPFKMHNRSVGGLYFHNTVVKTGTPWPLYTSEEVEHAISRNNLVVGSDANYAFEFSPRMTKCDFDYDGFGGGPFRSFAKWNGRVYATIEEFRANSGIERHAVWLGEGSPFASGIRAPSDFKRQFPLAVNDLRLAPGSSAVDAGARLPNVNDGFRGQGPDLGAYELGEKLPHYGPRGR